MSDLLNVAKSGMVASRVGLTTTGENVANANTEGYSRREVMTSEMSGSTANPYFSAMNGHGVMIDDVRRAFDSLVIGEVRRTATALASAETMEPALEQLENRMLPEAGGIKETLADFFESVEGLAGTPEDNGLRSVVLQAGTSLAGAVADMADNIGDLATYLQGQGEQVVDRVNGILQELHRLQEQIGVNTIPGANNSIMDRRDLLLTDLSMLVEIQVSYGEMGQARVTMGNIPGGPVLLDENGPARVSMNSDLALVVRPASAASAPEETQVRAASGGRLHGLASALSAVNATLHDLNDWAQALSDEMNAVHMASRDENGDPGGRIFSLNGWDAAPAPANRGSVIVETTEVDGETPPDGDIRLIRDEVAGLWLAYDDTGTLLGNGTNQVVLPGVVIDVIGQPAEGDVIDLQATHGEAQNMRFLLDDIDQIATGGGLTVVAATANGGDAELSVSTVDRGSSGLPLMSDILPADGSSTTLISDGVIGVVPASASELTLASLNTGGSPSDIMVFTREGTQIAGPMLTAADAAALMTEANGFVNGAIYDGSLTGQTSNYLGTQLSTDGSGASAQWLRLTNLPYEDLIVVAGPGDLEIGGNITAGDGTEPDDRSMRMEVINAGTGEVELRDQISGHRLGGGIIDADGNVEIAGFSLTLTGTLQNGDLYDIGASSSGPGDARGLNALVVLRLANNETGVGGYDDRFTEMRTEVGGMLAAVQTKVQVDRARSEAAEIAFSASSGVDLDTEAAQLMKYQQAYQANTRVMSVAREIFSTLINSL
ncbi:MAG: flagellar hook-associated protein FlgK [Thalassovita sp.]|nr:flagellar hook-associated protein FlgK [Thalassovita sp.]